MRPHFGIIASHKLIFKDLEREILIHNQLQPPLRSLRYTKAWWYIDPGKKKSHLTCKSLAYEQADWQKSNIWFSTSYSEINNPRLNLIYYFHTNKWACIMWFTLDLQRSKVIPCFFQSEGGKTRWELIFLWTSIYS